MIDPELLEILCCPETHQEVRRADGDLIQRLNGRIATGGLHNRAGQVVTGPIEEGLIRSDEKFLYPVRHNVPIMLVDEAIPLGD